MKNKLKAITDNTINDLLQNEIILPSTYFQTFDKHAKTLQMNLEDESFEKEVNDVIVEEFATINNYMTQTISNIQKLSTATLEAQEAIAKRDENELSKIYKQMQTLENEITSLQDKMYMDSLTKCKNKKWIYAEFINEEGLIQKSGFVASLQIKDFEYIEKEHGGLIADNLLRFFSEFMQEKLEDEGVDFDLVRYSKHRFILFVYENNKKEIQTILNNTQKSLLNTTLKSKSGILIKTSYEYDLYALNEKESFQTLLEQLNFK